MREIKFRAWDSKVKAMFPVHDMNFCKTTNQLNSIYGVDIYDKDSDYYGDVLYGGSIHKKTGSPGEPLRLKFELMQYTGLKDKNGVEIYEGDILRFPAKNYGEEKNFIGYEIFYHDNDSADRHVGFQMNRMHFYGNLCGGECRGQMLPNVTARMEIISNIYEQGDSK